MRVLHTNQGTVSGYFDDMDRLSIEAAKWSGRAPAVYVTLNPVLPDLLARAHNRLKVYARATTSDEQITRRRWLPIDFDPKRPSDISSTDAEKDAAMARAIDCREFLRAEGWPEPIFADSGNGAHLLYAIEQPNDMATRDLLTRALEALSLTFDDEAVKVDRTTFNAARIWKLYGTMSCKGDDMPDRPHRMSCILEAAK